MASNGNGVSSVEPPAPDMAEPEQETTGTNGFVIQEDANTTYLHQEDTGTFLVDALHLNLVISHMMSHIMYDEFRGMVSMSSTE